MCFQATFEGLKTMDYPRMTIFFFKHLIIKHF